MAGERIIEMEYFYQNVSRIYHNKGRNGKFVIKVKSYEGQSKTNNINLLVT